MEAQQKNAIFAGQKGQIMEHEAWYEAAVALLKTMVAIPSVSRDEAAVADMLQSYIAARFTGEVHRTGHNLWMVDPCYDVRRPTLLLNAHIDTVRPVASWVRAPFTPTEEGEGSEKRLYGLGTNDDGASLVTLLHVFLYMTSQPEGRQYNVMFVASAEEEVSGKNGIESVLPLLPPVTVAVVGEPTDMQPAVAEKGLVVLDGLATGRSGHAARNEGDNALYKAVEAIDRLRRYRFPQESAMLGPVKVTVTGIAAGTVHNVIPDRCTFMVDCRTTDMYSNERVVAMLQEEMAGLDVTLTPRSTRLQPSGIAEAHPLIQRLKAMGRTPFGSPTLSDQALMRFPSVKIGPGKSARSHTADEFIYLREIAEAFPLYLNLFRGLSLV